MSAFTPIVTICATGEKLNLDGQTITKVSFSPTDAYARLKIDNNGNVYRSVDTGVASWSQIDSAADWVRPTSAAPGAYEVRYTSRTGSTLSFNTASEDTWHPLSSGDFILYNSVTAVSGDRDSTFTVEIRDGSSGSADVSATYRLWASVEFA
jgi:hypothetical protein